MKTRKAIDEPRIVKRGGVVNTSSLSIEGPVVSRWLPILELQSRWLLRDADKTYVDLAGVTEVDSAGAKMLKAIATSYGVQILGCPPPVAEKIFVAADTLPN